MELVAWQPFSEDRVLLQELTHRINNEMASAIAVVSLALARARDETVKAALSHVTELLHHYAEVHHALEMPEYDTYIDAAAYLRKLCLSISRSKLDYMKIDLVLATSPLHLQSSRCWRLGMIVCELITNAARHAFAGGTGEILVNLSRAGAFVECMVRDSGSAPASVRPGRGLKIIGELAKGLDGHLVQRFGTRGSTSVLVFPYGDRPEEQ